MAWYYGTFSCGHEGRVNIIGPGKDREWKAENAFSKLCEECWEKKRQEEREEEKKKALEKAKEMELPELTGSEKQIIWAITLRDKTIVNLTNSADNDDYIKHVVRFEEELEDITGEDILKIRDFIIENETSSKFYIDNRHKKATDLILEYKDIALKDQREIIEEKKLEEEIEKEALIVPENKIIDNAVTIKEEKSEVVAEFEKNQDFIDIVKSLGYKWGNGAWRKEISETTGTSTERIAELGNKLLCEGFPVKIYNQAAKEKAISGDYEQENDRWIFSRPDDEVFVIKWSGKNDKLYKRARSLPGSKWDSGVTVPFSKWDEIEEFAELYGFNFTESTIRNVEEYKKQFKKDKAKVIEVEDVEEKDGLKNILEDKTEILEDLKDD